MTDQAMYVTMALSGLTGVGVVAGATLAGWRGWLQLRRAELDRGQVADLPVRWRADRDRGPEGAHPQAGGDRGRSGPLGHRGERGALAPLRRGCMDVGRLAPYLTRHADA